MTFRTKVLVLLVGMALLTVVLALFFSRILQDRLGSQALSVAATTAAFIDGDHHKQAVASRDKNSAACFPLLDVMRRARDANRRGDFLSNTPTLSRCGRTSHRLSDLDLSRRG